MNLKQEIYDSLSEWEDGENITIDDVNEKTKQMITLMKRFIDEKLESDDGCQHKSYDNMPETWHKTGKISGLQELAKEILK